MSHALGLMIESLVAILLLLTIGYCMILNNRLKLLKADEGSLKATIAELVIATEIAERAVAGLKSAAKECDETLGHRLRLAERVRTDLGQQVGASEIAINRLSRLLVELRPAIESAPMISAPHPKALAAAAQALADRARDRMTAIAA
jgi:hypothetical protein